MSSGESGALGCVAPPNKGNERAASGFAAADQPASLCSQVIRRTLGADELS
jgi:hypothetical protein